MASAWQGAGAPDYEPVRYGASRTPFRGPRRDLDGPYVACLGGTATYGKFALRPFPALVEAETGLAMVNLGCVNAGPDLFLNDADVLRVAQGARAAVVQVMGAQNLTNAFYAVHPRRNDRFLRASPALRAMFPRVDFTDIHFTRHLLQALAAAAPDRFATLAEHLRAAWVGRMTHLLGRLGVPTVLLWVADHAPGDADAAGGEPLLVTGTMVAAVAARATVRLDVTISAAARAEGPESLAFAPLDRPAAEGVPGAAAHREVADRLAPVLARLV